MDRRSILAAAIGAAGITGAAQAQAVIKSKQEGGDAESALNAARALLQHKADRRFVLKFEGVGEALLTLVVPERREYFWTVSGKVRFKLGGSQVEYPSNYRVQIIWDAASSGYRAGQVYLGSMEL